MEFPSARLYYATIRACASLTAPTSVVRRAHHDIVNALLSTMRISYCTNVRLPSERAHGHQIAQVCAALHNLGHEMTIYGPLRRNPVKETFNNYYHLPDSILMKYIRVFDPINRWWLPGPLGLWTLNMLMRPQLKRELQVMKPELIYTRTVALLGMLLSTGIPVALELHTLPRINRILFVDRCNRCTVVVCLTNAMRDVLLQWGVEESKIIVEGDAFDPALFHGMTNPIETKRTLLLKHDVPVIGYTGQLKSMGLSKGLPELLATLKELHARNVPFQALIAGGPDSARKELEQSLDPELRLKIRFLGWVPHNVIAHTLAACDILVYPAPKSDHPYYQRDVSPLKIFEYMAAGKPVVCADLPPLHDVLDDSVVAFCEPGSATACADAIEKVIKDPAYARSIAKKAQERVQRHTWLARMERIMNAAAAQL